jgi:hypothetical protein
MPESFSFKTSIAMFGQPFGSLSKEGKLAVRATANRDYYQRNKDAVIARTGKNQKENRQWHNEYNRAYLKRNPEQKAHHDFLTKRWKFENPERSKLKRMRSGAKKRGIPFSLDTDYFVDWLKKTPKICSFCDITESELEKYGSKNFTAMTVDRMDNALGYVIENLCLACYKCNTKKGDDIPFSVMREIGQKYLKPLWVARIGG